MQWQRRDESAKYRLGCTTVEQKGEEHVAAIELEFHSQANLPPPKLLGVHLTYKLLSSRMRYWVAYGTSFHRHNRTNYGYHGQRRNTEYSLLGPALKLRTVLGKEMMGQAQFEKMIGILYRK